ncbi:hypothetical protein EC968_007007 [Mortierella alpina]|nr:hypothetical protein EC968_007007 [Mortierella alpina]
MALPSPPSHLSKGRSSKPTQIRDSIAISPASAIGACGAGRHGFWRIPVSDHKDLCRHPLHTSASQQASAFGSLQRFSALSQHRSTTLRPGSRLKSHPMCHCIRQHFHYHHHYHHHHPNRSHCTTPAKRIRSTYDPELAACMDRWIRITFTGQRRMQSSLVKPMPTLSTATYNVVDTANSMAVDDTYIPLRTLQQYDDPARPGEAASESTRIIKSDEGPTPSANQKVVALRKSLSHIPIEGYDPALPFTSLSQPGWKRKPMFSKAERKAVDRVWHQYLKLVRGGHGGDLSKQDYTTLMCTVRHSWDPREGAARILTLHEHINKAGVVTTRKMAEMGIQAHIILGSMSEAVQLFHEIGRIAGKGSVEQRRVLEVMLDGLNTNQMELDGIAFLDSFPTCSAAGFKPPLNFQHLYQRLLSDQLRSLGGMDASLKATAAIKRFLQSPIPPRLLDVRRVLWILESDSDTSRLVYDFSRRFSGLLVKTADAKTITPLLQSILSTGHVQEAVRLLDLMLAHGLEPDLEEVRLYLMHNLAKSTVDMEEKKGVIAQWDLMAPQRIRQSRETSGLIRDVEHAELDPDITSQYVRLVSKCIKKDDISGALNVASYICMRGWSTSELDFKQLNSHMVNYGRSNAFVDYLDVRYTLGGVSNPDLHTFRRLVYAACRRSDLYSALSLFKLLRVRHTEWYVDASIYNAIISTAGATGHIRVAERTFRCLLEDGVQPDRSTFHGLLNGYTNAKDLEAAVLIPEQMVKHKLTPTTRTFNLVMKAYLGTRCDLATARKLFRVMQLSGHSAVPPDLVTFNQLLEGHRRVGNTQWFDAYFDRFFGQTPQSSAPPQSSSSASSSLSTPVVNSRAVTADGSDDLPSEQAEQDICDAVTSQSKKASRRAKAMPVRPESSDDKTLLVQLKHSLLLPNIDLPTIWELWRAIEPKFVEPQPIDATARAIASDTVRNTAPNLIRFAEDPPRSTTHVPFKKRMGDLSLPATDSEHFRFTTLTLFRAAFRSRGDVSGVKQMDRILSDLFPNHPMGQAVIAKQGIKRSRIHAKKPRRPTRSGQKQP